MRHENKTLIDEVEELITYIDLVGKRQYPSLGIYVILHPHMVEELRSAVEREREGAAIIADQHKRMSQS